MNEDIKNLKDMEFQTTPPPSSNDNLVFVEKKVKFSEEDEEKMKTMSTQERIQYKRKLKTEGRYVYENEQ